MKDARVLCYLRTHRRLWDLTQIEVAQLIGFGSRSQISRLENCKRGPSVETALACQVLFGISPADMFPNLHRQVEERVIQSAYRMHQGLENITSLSNLRKRELLQLALKRAVGKLKPLLEV